MTIRSDDQFNTSIYTLNDRFRGVYGTRRVLLMNIEDIELMGFKEGDRVTVSTVARDEYAVRRSVEGLRVTPYDIPRGCAAGYYPECNRLIPSGITRKTALSRRRKRSRFELHYILQQANAS